MEVLAVGRIPPSPNWKMKAHSHADHCEIIMPMRGKLHLAFEGQKQVARAGDICFYAPQCWHEEISDKHDPVELIFLAFREPDPGDSVRIIHDRRHTVRKLAQFIYDARQRDATARQIEAYAVAILEEYHYLENTGEEDELVSGIRAFMIQNLGQPLTVDDMAAQADMSSYHFIRTYKKLTGTTPAADFRRLRIEEACSLLESTNLPLKAIAPMMGFSNEYHFSRVFKKVTGISPGQYRIQR